MKRTENKNGTVTWELTSLRASNSDLENNLAGLNYNAVVIEKTRLQHTSTVVEFTVPLEREDIAVDMVQMTLQSHNFLSAKYEHLETLINK